ncbi:MAG TPA: hypothetical protein VJN62_02290 [Gemmatimonadales bacterium]|nr:hypothetical protein [Gemmatimonadales bacterium]
MYDHQSHVDASPVLRRTDTPNPHATPDAARATLDAQRALQVQLSVPAPVNTDAQRAAGDAAASQSPFIGR